MPNPKIQNWKLLEGRMIQGVEKFHTWPHVTDHPQGILQVLYLKLCLGCVNEIHMKNRWTAHLNLISTPMIYHAVDTNIPQSKVVWNLKHFWVPAFWERRDSRSVVEGIVSRHSGSPGCHLHQNEELTSSVGQGWDTSEQQLSQLSNSIGALKETWDSFSSTILRLPSSVTATIWLLQSTLIFAMPLLL